jgi:hypothetical protein
MVVIYLQLYMFFMAELNMLAHLVMPPACWYSQGENVLEVLCFC